MAVTIGSARSAYGNTKAGDQSGGREVSAQRWYLHKKGWTVIRARDAGIRAALARAMRAACENPHIGYSQADRLSLYNHVKTRGFDPARTIKDVNCDCSSLVRVCVLYALTVCGMSPSKYDPGSFRTATQVKAFEKTGLFDILRDDAHCRSSARLAAGDILVTASGSGHTVIVLTDGPSCDAENAVERPYVRVLGGTVALRRGAGVLHRAVGYAHRGDCLPYLGHDAENGWHAVALHQGEVWITNKPSLTEVVR